MDAPTTSAHDRCRTWARQARAASRSLALASTLAKNCFLEEAARRLQAEQAELLAANAQDVAAAVALGQTPALVDRLRLTPERVAAMAAGLRAVAALPDPIGQVVEGHVRPNGLEVRKVRVPLGVVLFIYESRPNVTVDAAGLAVKSGNAILLRGGSEAKNSNAVLAGILGQALEAAALPSGAVQCITQPGRELVGELLQMNDLIDLVIPRGGESLIRRVAAEAKMPVLKHYQGNCHLYVHAAADLDMAERLIINAKCQRPGTCNALESLLVDAAVAAAFLPRIVAALRSAGVEVRGCPRCRAVVPDLVPASETDFATEYLDLIISVAVVDGLDAAMRHVERYGSGHTEAIVTQDLSAARTFTTGVDAAAVIVNASTRFHDGFELGLGAEIGISTDKFHARGPCGLVELTTTKYVVYGAGQVRG